MCFFEKAPEGNYWSDLSYFNSKSFKVLALSFGKLMTMISSLVLFSVLARLLSVSEYATYRQTILVYQFSLPLLSFALPQSLYFFMPTVEDKRTLVFSNLVVLATSGTMFCLFLVMGGNELIAERFNNPELEQTLLILAYYPFLILPIMAANTVLVACNKVVTLSVFNVLSKLFVVLCVIVTCLFMKNPYHCIIALVVATIFTFLCALYLMYIATHGRISLNVKMIKSMLTYSMPLGISSLFGTIYMYIDKLIVSSYCSPETFSIYINGATQIPFTTIITGSVTAVILVEMTQMSKRGEMNEAMKLFRLAALKCSYFLLPVMCFFFIFADDFMVILYSSKYSESAYPFRLYLLMIPLRMISFGAPLMAAGKTKEILYRSAVGLLINLVLSITLVHYFGYIGAIWGTIITLYTWNVPFNLYLIGKIYGCKKLNVLPLKKFVLVFGFSLLPIPFLLWFKSIGSHLNHLVVFGLSGIIYFIFIILIFNWRGYVKIPNILYKLNLTSIPFRR